MKNKIIVLVLCTILMGCNGQKKESVSKTVNSKIVMKKLDSTYLNKIKKLKNEKIQFTENDTVVELLNVKKAFLERRKKNGEKLEKRFAYDKNSNTMIASGTYFYEIPIGIHKKYNEKGEVIEERNEDLNYPFSVYDLIQKIKETHHIDLNNTTKVNTLERLFDKTFNKYIYIIKYRENPNDENRYIAVDGQTGEILGEGITIGIPL